MGLPLPGVDALPREVVSKKELEDRKAELRNKDREMEELEERAKSAPPEELAKLQELVALCERLNQQKAEFKKQCARQLEEMNRELETLETTAPDPRGRWKMEDG